MAEAYATLEDVKRHLRIQTSDTSLDETISAWLEPMSRVIDNHTRRWFYELTETRRYDFQDSWKLRLGRDLYSLTTLTNGDGDVLVQDTDFYLYPDLGPPYRWVEIRRDVGNTFRWSGTPQRCISVTGVWGDCRQSSKDVVRVALCSWIGYLVTATEEPGVSSKSIGSFSVSYTGLNESLKTMPGEVQAMLAPLIFRQIGDG